MEMVQTSIIVVIYNKEKYLLRCVESILEQTVGDFELIMVDDGSTDGSLEIISGLEKKDRRIRVFSKHNGGVYSARNVGLDAAQGRFICFVDPDDYVLPQYLGNLLEVYGRGGGRGFAVTGLRQVSERGEKMDDIALPDMTLGKDDFRKLFTEMTIANYGYTCAKLYDRQLIEEKQLRFVEVRSREDLYFMLAYIMECDFIAMSSSVDYIYIRYADSVSAVLHPFDCELLGVSTYRSLIERIVEAYSLTYSDIASTLSSFMINFQRAIKADYQPKYSVSLSSRIAHLRSVTEQNHELVSLYYHPDYLIDRIGRRLLISGCFRLYDSLVSLVFRLRLRNKMFAGPH